MNQPANQPASRELNGVDLDGLHSIIETCTAEPAKARAEWRATNEWRGGARSETALQHFKVFGLEDGSRSEPFVIEADEPSVLLGTNRGANPVEHVLAGLLGCLTTTLVYFAAAEGIELLSVRSRAESDIDVRGMLGLDESVRPGFRSIRVRFEVEAGRGRERLEELMETVRRRSVVLDTLVSPVPVSVELAA
jgi:uncharacterized OsmC-like protein